MTAPPTIAVTHYPEGAGHATRMLAVADELERAGVDVRMAGGGAGTRFVALNGYDEFEPTTVDYIDTYQGGSMRDVLAESVPATAARVTDYVEWLRDVAPDAVVTDDMFAAIAATRTDVGLYVLKHDVPALYQDRVERTGAAFHTEFQLSAAREFFYPAVWPPSGTEPDGVTRVPPVALEGDARERPATGPDVVVVPSHYSDLQRVADNLARQGYDVLDVGDDDWEPVASLLPYLGAADVVVCSGYSTVMDAAVAGTPCVVHPATDEQEAVGDWLDRFDVTGFAVADRPIDVLEAVASPPDAPSFENGAPVVADAVLDDLHRRRTGTEADEGGVGSSVSARSATAASGDDTTHGAVVTEGGSGRLRRLADRAVSTVTALEERTRTAVRGSRSHVRVAKQRGSSAAAVARRRALRARRSLVDAADAAATTLLGAARTTAWRCRRYGTATAAMVVATLVVANSGLRKGSRRCAGALGSRVRTLGTVAAGSLQRGVGAARTVADVATAAADRAAELGRRLRDAAGPTK